MAIRVALNHRTTYHYDRYVTVGPQLVRLRPAPHCETPITSYSLKVTPEEHFVNWQQDPYGNYIARFVFPEPVKSLEIEVDFVAEMTVINPFDFFIEESADEYPFVYDAGLRSQISVFLRKRKFGKRFQELVNSIDTTPRSTTDFLVSVNLVVHNAVSYCIRMAPGVQTPEQTLKLGTGSCRDSAWLLVHVLRQLGLAARFVSGYLIQLKPDVKALDGPSGAEEDFTDLHAWVEAYIPGAGWVGLDPTSGLFAGEGHVPVACTPDVGAAAPISGAVDPCETEFDFSMTLTRIHEDPRVTKPYADATWNTINQLGHAVDEKLNNADVRLTMGGEPTFISIDDMEGEEWTVAAVGEKKRELSEQLIKRLRNRFGAGGLLHYGQGKWYPGEPLPRWALTCFWRVDGQELWRNADLIADVDKDYGHGIEDARTFATKLAEHLGVDSDWVVEAYEDTLHYLWKEQRLPKNVDPLHSKLDTPQERAALARTLEAGFASPSGFVLPLQRQW